MKMADSPALMKPSLAPWFALYSALAIVATLPLVFHIPSKVPHDLGDPLLSTSILWWNAHVLPLTARWWDGFSFAPAAGSLAFSDHRLGVSLLAAPLQWIGCSPVTAYNLTLLAMFPLSAIAAHWLAFTLTKRHDAALLCGLAYGFNPYRMAHIEHLELLAAFGMPAALAALHLYADTRRVKWLVFFALAVVLQGLCASYYVLFFGVLIVLWLAWFTRAPDWRLVLTVVAAYGASAIVLSPIAIGYWAIHHRYGLTRVMAEIVAFSGDLSSLVTASPLLALWGWTGGLNGSEKQLFPGLIICALALVGGIAALRSRPRTDEYSYRPSAALGAVAVLLTGAAVHVALMGPWRMGIAGLSLSATTPLKPFSMAVATAVGAIALLPQIRAAFRRRSALAFYLVATGVLFACSFGPKPALLGQQILYESPYAWLMRLPVFTDGIRAPARFAMVAVLALAVSGAIAFSRFRLTGRTRHVAVAALACGIFADGWVGHLPLVTPPAAWATPQAQRFPTAIELPLGDVGNDAAAMYRATKSGLRVVNGYSGYMPGYYFVLKLALEAYDVSVLDALNTPGPLLIAVDQRADPGNRWPSILLSQPGVTLLQAEPGWAFFELAPKSRQAEPPCMANPVVIRAVADNRGPADLAAVTDGNWRTWWETPGPQQPGDAFTLDLGLAVRACELKMLLGPFVERYPRRLSVETSLDGVTWTLAFAGPGGGVTLRGALDEPGTVPVRIPLSSAAVRYIRTALVDTHPWRVTEMIVSGASGREPR
jgi:hypothetical protein